MGVQLGALALELVSTDTGSALEFVSIDAASALEFVSTDTGSVWSWSSFLKWEESQVIVWSPPSAVSILWFLFFDCLSDWVVWCGELPRL